MNKPVAPLISEPRSIRTSPWIVSIVIGFIILLLVNGAFIYVAVKGADQVVPSYSSEER